MNIERDPESAFLVDAQGIPWTHVEFEIPIEAAGGNWVLSLTGMPEGQRKLPLSETNRVLACELDNFLDFGSMDHVGVMVSPPEGSALHGVVSAEVPINREKLRTASETYFVNFDSKILKWKSLDFTSEAIRNFTPSMTIDLNDQTKQKVMANPKAHSGEDRVRVDLVKVRAVRQSLASVPPLRQRAKFLELEQILQVEDDVERCVGLRKLFGLPDGTVGESVSIYTQGAKPDYSYQDGTIPISQEHNEDPNFSTIWLESDQEGVLRNAAGETISHRLACTEPVNTDNIVTFVFFRQRHDTAESTDFTRTWKVFVPNLAIRLRDSDFRTIVWSYLESGPDLGGRYNFNSGELQQVAIDTHARFYLKKLRQAGTTGLIEGDRVEPDREDVLEAIRQYRVGSAARKIIAFVPVGAAPTCLEDSHTPACDDRNTLWWEGSLNKARIEELSW